MLPASPLSSAPRTRRALTLMLAACLTGGLAACAPEQSAQTEDFTGVRGEVQDAVQKLSERADRDDAAGICRDLIDPKLRAMLGDAGCAESVKEAIQGSDYVSLDVASIEVDQAGTTAVAQIKPVEDADERRSITLTRADAKAQWTVLSLDPSGKTRLPEGSGATTPPGTTPAETTPASTPAG